MRHTLYIFIYVYKHWPPNKYPTENVNQPFTVVVVYTQIYDLIIYIYLVYTTAIRLANENPSFVFF